MSDHLNPWLIQEASDLITPSLLSLYEAVGELNIPNRADYLEALYSFHQNLTYDYAKHHSTIHHPTRRNADAQSAADGLLPGIDCPG